MAKRSDQLPQSKSKKLKVTSRNLFTNIEFTEMNAENFAILYNSVDKSGLLVDQHIPDGKSWFQAITKMVARLCIRKDLDNAFIVAKQNEEQPEYLQKLRDNAIKLIGDLIWMELKNETKANLEVTTAKTIQSMVSFGKFKRSLGNKQRFFYTVSALTAYLIAKCYVLRFDTTEYFQHRTNESTWNILALKEHLGMLIKYLQGYKVSGVGELSLAQWHVLFTVPIVLNDDQKSLFQPFAAANVIKEIEGDNITSKLYGLLKGKICAELRGENVELDQNGWESAVKHAKEKEDNITPLLEKEMKELFPASEHLQVKPSDPYMVVLESIETLKRGDILLEQAYSKLKERFSSADVVDYACFKRRVVANWILSGDNINFDGTSKQVAESLPQN